jgi:hypothetical protein
LSDVPFIDVLPDMPKRPRRDEILAWLKAHPNTDRFVWFYLRASPGRLCIQKFKRGARDLKRSKGGRRLWTDENDD